MATAQSNRNTIGKHKRNSGHPPKGVTPPQLIGKTFAEHPERINRNGRPRTADYLRKIIQEMGEVKVALTKQEQKRFGVTVTHVTRVERLLLDQLSSTDFHKHELVEAYGWGKPTDKAFDPDADTRENFVLPADMIAKSFLDVYRDIRHKGHTEYVLYGGRGSTKSSFISLSIIDLIICNPVFNAVVMRQVADTMRTSIYTQLKWAIDELGFADSFNCTVSPLEITYKPTGQKIYFRGADDPGKLKSIKVESGYIAILWMEELDQFHGAEGVRKIEQSVIRGGESAFIFKSFNPPPTANNWANKYVLIPKDTQYQHSSTYLDVPVEWLGKPFIEEAEHLKTVNPKAYEHEYLGVVNSAGGMVFENLEIRPITDNEIFGKKDKQGNVEGGFDRILEGIDWGYYPDPFAWGKMYYDAARLTLYIFDEYRDYKKSNRETYNYLVNNKGYTPDQEIIADSAEPKSIGDYRDYGASIRGAEKAAGSVDYSIKWLQSLRAIVIDNVRCPETAEEFMNYEYERNRDDEIISGFPDERNHSIDVTRYATNRIWKRRGQ